jgi:hypothetical protein
MTPRQHLEKLCIAAARLGLLRWTADPARLYPFGWRAPVSPALLHEVLEACAERGVEARPC